MQFSTFHLEEPESLLTYTPLQTLRDTQEHTSGSCRRQSLAEALNALRKSQDSTHQAAESRRTQQSCLPELSFTDDLIESEAMVSGR